MRPPFFMVFHKSVIYIDLALPSAPALFCNIFCACIGKCARNFSAASRKRVIYFAPGLPGAAPFLRIFAKAQYILRLRWQVRLLFFAFSQTKIKLYFAPALASAPAIFLRAVLVFFCAVCCNVLSQLFAGYFTESILTLSAAHCNSHFFIWERLISRPKQKIKKSLNAFGASYFFT